MICLWLALALVTLVPFVLQYVSNLLVGRQDVAAGFWFTGGSLVFLLLASGLCRILANVGLKKKLRS